MIKLKLIKSESLREELLSLHSFRKLPGIIEKLETSDLSVAEQLNLIEQTKEFLPEYCLAKLKNCLKKNPGLEDFTGFVSKNNSVEFRLKTTYAPLVSCDVERSFSQ